VVRSRSPPPASLLRGRLSSVEQSTYPCGQLQDQPVAAAVGVVDRKDRSACRGPADKTVVAGRGDYMTTRRKFAALLCVAAITGAFSAPALGQDFHPPTKCKAGIGNGFESTADNDCDPGNSGGVNQGGG
jgi:hypothetical protein